MVSDNQVSSEQNIVLHDNIAVVYPIPVLLNWNSMKKILDVLGQVQAIQCIHEQSQSKLYENIGL